MQLLRFRVSGFRAQHLLQDPLYQRGGYLDYTSSRTHQQRFSMNSCKQRRSDDTFQHWSTKSTYPGKVQSTSTELFGGFPKRADGDIDPTIL